MRRMRRRNRAVWNACIVYYSIVSVRISLTAQNFPISQGKRKEAKTKVSSSSSFFLFLFFFLFCFRPVVNNRQDIAIITVCVSVCVCVGFVEVSNNLTAIHFRTKGEKPKPKKTCSSTLDVRDDIRNQFRQSPPFSHYFF